MARAQGVVEAQQKKIKELEGQLSRDKESYEETIKVVTAECVAALAKVTALEADAKHHDEKTTLKVEAAENKAKMQALAFMMERVGGGFPFGSFGGGGSSSSTEGTPAGRHTAASPFSDAANSFL